MSTLAQRKQSLWYRVAILPKRARDVKQERPREGSALIVDAKTLLVINDNNYPAGQGHGFNSDNNEFILIGLADRLRCLNLDVDSPAGMRGGSLGDDAPLGSGSSTLTLWPAVWEGSWG